MSYLTCGLVGMFNRLLLNQRDIVFSYRYITLDTKQNIALIGRTIPIPLQLFAYHLILRRSF